jgi:hypothetical protein
MKKLILLIVLCLGAKSFAQTNGITYQAVILNPNGEQLPGVNNTNAPMVDKNICMQFQFIDAFAKLEYQETIQTKTDSFGMVNLVIGSGKQTAGYAASFQSIEWNALKKSMIVSINTSGSCSSFTEISNQPFTAVPFAFSAINSGNVTGVVDIKNGGTNAVTVIGAKTNLGLEKLDNTSDLDKPISNATLVALNLNTSAISVNATAISLNTAKTGITNQQASAITANTAKVGYTEALVSANTDVAANNAKTGITAQQASDITANNAKTGITTHQASDITANNAKVSYPGDQDLSALATTAATTTALDLKADLASPSFTGTVTVSALVVGTNTYPTTQGAANQVLTTDGSGSLTWSSPSTTTTVYNGTVPVANGGTGQSTIGGVKGALGLTDVNVAIGANSGRTSQGNGAIGVGWGAGETSQGNSAIAIGNAAGSANQGANSVAIGPNAAQSNQATEAVAIGYAAGQVNQAAKSVALGGFSNAPFVNSTAIGYQASSMAANTIQLGADGVSVAGSIAITNVKTSGTLTAGTVTYPNAHNSTAGQVLTTDVAGLASWAPAAVGGSSVTEITDEVAVTSTDQRSFTLSQTPSTKSVVKIYINGIRISNTAITVNVKAVTYVPANNGAYALTIGDRIQFDYYY